MDPEAVWDELTAAALLGTERRPFTPPSVPAPLDTLLAGLSGREPEKALLGTAAAVSSFRRAGRQPIKREASALEPAEIDARPRCSAGADGHLELILAGIHDVVLPEWLDILNGLGQRPADEALPQLLDLGRSKAEIRPKIVLAVGPLGAWLARQNPDWAYASGAGLDSVSLEDEATIETIWQTDTTESRTTLLRRIRQSRPQKARELVASTWTTDPADDRAKFLETFVTGLTLDDEPFLEAALDDRRKEVRFAASELLRRLPGSALVGRMIDRVAPLLTLIEDKPGEFTIDGTLPGGSDKAMIRDGLEVKLFRHGIGEKANWLYLMVARIPPAHWSRTWSRSPSELARAAVKSRWGDALYPALAEAAAIHQDDEWLDAILPAPGTRTEDLQSLQPVRHARPGLDPQAVPGRQGPRPPDRRPDEPAPTDDGSLGVELASLVLERFRRNLAHKGRLSYGIVGFLKTAACSLPTAPVLAEPLRRTSEFVDVADYAMAPVDRQLEEFHALIQFRHEMTQELRR